MKTISLIIILNLTTLLQLSADDDQINLLKHTFPEINMYEDINAKSIDYNFNSHISNRYITNRFLPDKAIDLIDEASSRLKMQIESQPEEIDIIERKILQLEMEKQAISREKSEETQKRLITLDNELSNLKSKKDSMKLHWTNEKKIIDQIGKIKSDLEDLRSKEDEFIRMGNLTEASKIKYGDKIQLEKIYAGRRYNAGRPSYRAASRKIRHVLSLRFL